MLKVERKKCIRCGGCCLAAPCFAIPFKEEKWITTETIRIHLCSHLTFDDNGIACCAIYLEVMCRAIAL